MSYHQLVETLTDSKVYRNRKKVKSSNSGDIHTISIRKSDNRWCCSCKGWIFTYQKKGGDCGHIAEIKRVYGDRSKVDQILAKVAQFTETLNGGMPTLAALKLWLGIRDEAEMLHLYLENEGKATEAVSLASAISSIKTKLSMVLA